MLIAPMSEDPFSGHFSFDRPLGPGEEGNHAFFGQNVLQGLIDGIDDFVYERQRRWERRTPRIGAPVLLGCSPWITDDALLEAIAKLPGACITLTKAPRRKHAPEALKKLRELNQKSSGVPLRVLSGLGHKAPKVAGRPQVMGPYDAVIRKSSFPHSARSDTARPPRSVLLSRMPSLRSSATSAGPTKIRSAASPTTSGSARSDCGCHRRTSPTAREKA